MKWRAQVANSVQTDLQMQMIEILKKMQNESRILKANSNKNSKNTRIRTQITQRIMEEARTRGRKLGHALCTAGHMDIVGTQVRYEKVGRRMDIILLLLWPTKKVDSQNVA